MEDQTTPTMEGRTDLDSCSNSNKDKPVQSEADKPNRHHLPTPGMIEINWVDEDEEHENHDSESGGEFARLLNDEGSGLKIREGTIVPGTVVSIDDDVAAIDIGHKCDGNVPLQEFKDSRGDLQVKVGDRVEVYLDTFEDNDGEMILSRERAEIMRSWDRVSEAFEKDEIVEGTIISRVKGGLAVDIGIKAFLPGSQVDLRPVKNFDHMLGNKFQFKIIKFNKRKNNVVLSRRVLLEQGREKLRSETLQSLKPGVILTGIVKNITDYGVFVDLGGIDGLLHITDMSWGRINHPSQLLEVGEETKVKVLNYYEAKQRVSLGYKQLQPDPWEAIESRYKIDSKVNGKVVSITDYGAFVELEPGVEGLIHVSEMSWSKKIKHPSKCVQIGDDVDVVVLSIDPEARRISLGMKQAEPNPWLALQDKYQVGEVIKGKVRNITEFGLFVGIGEGVDGLVHISDISWTERVNHPGDLYRKGSEIEAKILQIDVEEGKFSLGIKQLQPDPFMKVAEQHPVGSQASGKVERISDFGVFISLGSGVEGLIHQTELSDKEFDKITDVCSVGDKLDFVVLSIDSEERKFSLSRKALLKNLQGQELREYIDTSTPKTKMADAFMKVRASQTEADPSGGEE